MVEFAWACSHRWALAWACVVVVSACHEPTGGGGDGVDAVDSAMATSDDDEGGAVGDASGGGMGDGLDYCPCLKAHLDSMNVSASCTYRKPEPPCRTAADCCPLAADMPPGFGCNVDAPYLYACEAGRCAQRSCMADEECVASFDQQFASDSGVRNLGCVTRELECNAGQRRYCGFSWQASSCIGPADCCPPEGLLPTAAGFECNTDHPFVYNCEDGSCRALECRQDAECDVEFNLRARSGHYENLGCGERVPLCKTRAINDCLVREVPQMTSSCSQAKDCCPSALPEGYVCNRDAPYLFDCVAGACALRSCRDSSECSRFFESELEAAGFENLGCVAHPPSLADLLESDEALLPVPDALQASPAAVVPGVWRLTHDPGVVSPGRLGRLERLSSGARAGD